MIRDQIKEIIGTVLYKPENSKEVNQLLNIYNYKTEYGDPAKFLMDSITVGFFQQYLNEKQINEALEYFGYKPKRDGDMIKFILEQSQCLINDKVNEKK